MIDTRLNYSFSDILSFEPSLTDQKIISNSIHARISVLKECLKNISTKYQEFKNSFPETEAWKNSYIKIGTFLKKKLKFHENLLKINLFSYSNDVVRQKITNFNYRPIFKDLNNPQEHFSQKFLEKVEKTLADCEDDLNIKLLLRDEYKFEVEGHFSGITTLDISSNQKYILTGSKDSTVKLWKKENFQLIRTIKRHKYTILKVFFKSSNFSFVSASTDGKILFFSISGELEDKIKCDSAIVSVDFSKNEKFLAYASIDSRIKVINLENKATEYAVIDSIPNIIEMKVSSSGNSIICGILKSQFMIVDLKSDYSSKIIEKSDALSSCFCFSEDEKILISGSYSGRVFVCTSETEEQIYFYGHPDSVLSVSISSNNFYVVAAGENFVFIWRLAQRSLARMICMELSTIKQVRFNEDNSEIIAGGSNSRLYKFSSYQKNLTAQSDLHDKQVICFKLLNKHDLVITATRDQDVRIWDIQERKLIKKISIMTNICKSISVTKSEKYLVISFKYLIFSCRIIK